MSSHSLRALCACAVLLHAGTAGAQQTTASAPTLKFSTSNYYFNRDFRDGSGQGKREEWAQPILLDGSTGWHGGGTVGFGLDALLLANIKLDGTSSEKGTGILPTGADGARSHLLRLAPTAKARIASTELRVGSFIPKEPILKASVSRALPQTFRGTQLLVKDIPNVELQLARFEDTWYRDGTGHQDLSLVSKSRRFSAAPTADHFDFGSVRWKAGAGLSLGYQHGELPDVYRQQVLIIASEHTLGDGKLRNEVRWYDSRSSGRALGGDIDNRMLNLSSSWSRGAHEFGLAYQGLQGRTAMPLLGGADGDVFNWSNIHDFLERDQRSVQLRYRIDARTLGAPGLSAMVRHVGAWSARPTGVQGSQREWERDIEVAYAFQSPALKYLSVKWQNGTLRSGYQRDADENRLIVQYARPLFAATPR